jgi:hypothetical protein
LTKLVLTIDWYINVLARIRINAFRIELVASSYEDLLSSAAASVSCDSSVGNAVYMLPSFYNHDCGMLFTYTFGMNASFLSSSLFKFHFASSDSVDRLTNQIPGFVTTLVVWCLFTTPSVPFYLSFSLPEKSNIFKFD